MKKRNGSRALGRVGLAAALMAAVLVLAGIWQQAALRQDQRELLAMLEESAGNYNEDRIVLASTSHREARAMAEALGGSLRITGDGSFALIRLPEGLVLEDVARNDAWRKYHSRISLDYNNFSVGTEQTEAEGDGGIRANFHSDEPMYPQQTWLDYVSVGDSWNVSMGRKADGEKVTVAVIDSGIDTDHPEFKDADGNSIISTRSYDATDDKIVSGYSVSVVEDEHGHGTAVAGIIAAQINGSGIMGAAPDVELLVIKCDVDKAGEFKSSADIIFGIYYAIEQDADIINMSLGAAAASTELEKALQLAVDSDVIPIAAAGNDSTAADHYPAAFNTVIGVGALAEDAWELADYSNFADNSDIVAPGTILTAAMGGGYTVHSGTSMAAPVVSAAAAIYRSIHPYATFEELRNDLLAAGRDLGEAGEDPYYGFGALDMDAFICRDKGRITYDYCTEDLQATTQVFVRQHTIQTIPEPERENIVFDDWYYDKGYTRVFDYDAWYTTEFVEDVTLYAKWVNEDDEDASVYSYRTLSDGTIEIAGYKGKRRYLTVPDQIDGLTVSSIGARAFSGNTRLREVILPAGLTAIRDQAFSGAARLRAVTFTGTGLQSIGMQAFLDCSALRRLELPDSVTTVGTEALRNCTALSEIRISQTSALGQLGDRAFSGSGLSYLYLPAGVSRFNGSVLAYCRNMRSVEIHPDNGSFAVRDGAVLSADGTVLVYYPAALTGTICVPEGVVTVGAYACTGSAAGQVTLPEGLVTIGTMGFAETKLTAVSLPGSVVTLEPGAFRNSTRLASLSFASDARLQVIGGDGISGGAFENCDLLPSPALPGSLQTIGENGFRDCDGITVLSVPAGVTAVGEGAFYGCNALQTVAFAENCGVSEIPESCFAYCSRLTGVTFPAGVETLGVGAFRSDYLLHTLNFGENSRLARVEDSCFHSCTALTQMQLPGTVTSIGKYAYAFSGLTGVHIPQTLTEIGDGAFGACYLLTGLTADEDHTVYAAVDNVLFSRDMTTVFCVPASRTGSYTLPDTVRITAPWSFYYDKFLTEVILPQGLLEIQHDSFYSCSSLRYIDIPDSVTNIGRNGFSNCRSMKSVTFGENSGLQRLGLYTFVSCGMTEITIPASVETMAQYVFSNCADLKRITFAPGSRLSYIAAYLLSGTQVEEVIFREGSALTHLQAHAFDGAGYLRSVDFGDAALDTIDNYAFYNCAALERITIPGTVTYLGRYAFYGCTGLDRFDIPASMEYLGVCAFGGTGSQVFFAAETLPAWAQTGWDEGIAGYFLAAKEYVAAGDWEYIITSRDTAALARYTGTADTLTIDTVDGLPVEKIGAGCFADNRTLTAVTIGAGIREIDNDAFRGCAARVTIGAGSVLERIGSRAFSGNATAELTLPDTVTAIGDGAFEDSGLTVLTIGPDSGLKTIGDRAFRGCGIESVYLPGSLETVGVEAFRNTAALTDVTIAGSDTPLKLSNSAFEGSGITGITLPARVSYIGEYTFGSCPALENIHVDEANTAYQDLDGVLLDSSGTTLIQYPCGRAGAYEIPAQISVLTYASFRDARGLTRVTFAPGSTVRTIGWQTFSGCTGLETITVPDTVISFDFYAFENCTALTEVVLGQGSGITGVYEGAFLGCAALQRLDLPATVIDIGDYAFFGCAGLTAFPLPENAQTKGIGAHAFSGCTGITEIPELKNLTDVGEYAFAHTAVSEFTVPASLKEIAESAFDGCASLEIIHCDADNEEYTAIDGALYDKGADEAGDYDALVLWPYGRVMVIGSGKTEITAEDTVFLKQNGSVRWALADSVTAIGERAFYDCKYLKSIPLTDNITTIGAYAFYGCASLEELTIPKNVTSLGRYFLYGCTSLKTLRFNAEAMTDLAEGNYVFANSSAMNFEVVVGARVPRIPAYLFNPGNCKNEEIYSYCRIRRLSFEDGSLCGQIGSYAFGYCHRLEEITIPEPVTTLGVGAFAYCSTMETVWFNAEAMEDLTNPTMNMAFFNTGCAGDGITMTVGSAVTRIPARLFQPHGSSANHPKLVTLQFAPDSVCTSIGTSAFWACEDLLYVCFPASITEIGNQAFSLCHKAFMVFDSEQLPPSLGTSWSGAAVILMPGDVHGITEGGMRYYIGADGNARVGAYGGKETAVTIPRYVDGVPVTEVLSGAFRYCDQLREVTIPEGITTIGSYAFSSCYKLEQVSLPATLETIGSNAFSYCHIMERIDIPKSVQSIGAEAFFNCYELLIVFEAEELPPDLGSSWSYSCVYCLAPKRFGRTDDGFGYWVNRDDTITLWRYFGTDTTLTLPGTVEGLPVTHLGGKIFYENALLRQVTLPDTLREIGAYTFYGCTSLLRVDWNQGLEIIGGHAFTGCTALGTAELPDSLREIGYAAFSECTGLSKVTIPAGMRNFDNYVFSNCTGLKTAGPIGGGYDYEFGWTDEIPARAFQWAEITAVSIPETAAAIGNSAFAACTGLTQIEIPASVTAIGAGAFDGCTGISTVTIPEAVTRIGDKAFAMAGLEEIRYEAAAVEDCSVSAGVFSGAGQNTDGVTVRIGSRVTRIPAWLFGTTSNGREVKFRTVVFESEDTCRQIGTYAFRRAKTLTAIHIPAGVTAIDPGAFEECANLVLVRIDSPAVAYGQVSANSNGSLLKYAQTVVMPADAVPGSCITEDFTAQEHFLIDGRDYVSYSKHDHAWAESEILAQWIECSQDGRVRWSCDTCGLEKTVVTAAHDMVETVTEEGDCLHDGAAYAVCSLCGFRTEYGIPASGDHSFGAWYTVEEAGEDTAGQSRRDCVRCGEYETGTFTTAASGMCGPHTSWVLTGTDHLWIQGSGTVGPFAAASYVPWTSWRTAITSVEIDPGVTLIGNHAFYGCSALKTVTIPDSVTDIGKAAFRECKALTGIRIPEGVTRIADETFYSCTGLTALTIPAGVTRIGTYAFYNCAGLTELTVPEGVTAIGNYACSRCSGLTAITLPDSLTDIGRYAFQSCTGLTGITIPAGVTVIGNAPFSGCTNLAAIHVDDGNKAYRSIGGVLFDRDGTTLAACPGALSGTYAVPEGVTVIADNAFDTCRKLTGVTMPEGVETIGSGAFNSCTALTTVTLPQSLRSIGSSAFSSCAALKEIVLPRKLTGIGSHAFYGCRALTAVTIPAGITKIENFTFSGCSGLTSVTIADSVSVIDMYVFQNCTSLTGITIPAGVTKLGSYAFSGCTGLADVTFTGSAPTIGSNAFYRVTADVYYPAADSTWTDTLMTGYGGTLTWKAVCESHVWSEWYVVRDAACTEAGETRRDCANCSTYETAQIPAAGHDWDDGTVTVEPTEESEGEMTYTCRICSAARTEAIPVLEHVHSYEAAVTEPTCTEQGFTTYTCRCGETYTGDDTDALGHAYEDGSCIRCGGTDPDYVPEIQVAAGWSGDLTWQLFDSGRLVFSGSGAMKNYTYKSEMPWYSYSDQITSVVMEDGVTAIGDYAFYGMGIASIEIPETVTAIGSYAFKGCENLDGVVLPSGLTKLGESAFYGCSALTAIEIPASLWTVQPYTFKNCTALETVIFNEGNLQKISDGAFYGTGLTELVLPDCLDILDVYAFKGCADLASITIGSGITEIREAVFYGTAIPTIEISEGVTKIGPYAFKNCVNLVSVDLPENLLSVGEASFYACTALASVELPDAVTAIGNYAFRKCAAIEALTFGANLETIGESSFYGCTGLTEIIIPDGVTTIGAYAFKTCTGLTAVTLGSSVETLGEGAFNTCTGLKTMVFPASLNSIGDYCFSGSWNLWKLTFEGNAPSIGTGAFKGLAATAFYPADNATWTADIMQNYGGTITWKAQ